jgi:DNA-binding helix-hairpin-helix protein with protein kinase domain
MQIYDESGTEFLTASKIASGGEGTVFRLQGTDDYCVKLYHSTSAPNPHRQDKLKALRNRSNDLKSYAALPISLGYSDRTRTKFLGIFMPFSRGSDIYELYNPQGRSEHFKSTKFDFIVRAAINLAAAFEAIQARGIVIGDINEQNIKVNHDATVTIIDCDSFQIHDGSKHYACNVGTPLWTPPELQGISLAGLIRTPNHDAFGLAQLLFMLLFAGRNPFAGKPINGKGMQPEEAIAKYAFAYDPDPALRLHTPPPGVPSFLSIPDAMQKMFCRAFRKGSGLGGSRPTPTEWRETFLAFERTLARCGFSSAHVYWKGAQLCPWCDVYRTTGLDLFPATASTTHYPQGNTLAQLVARLRVLRLLSPSVQLPPPPLVQSCQLPPKPAGLWSGVVKSFSAKAWTEMWLAPHIKKYKNLLAVAEAEINQANMTIASSYAKYRSFAEPRLREISRLIVVLSNPESLRQEKLVEIKSKRRDIELKHYLQGHLIRRANISGVGPGRTATLNAFGVICAADIEARKIMSIDGFGPTITKQLLKWKNTCEVKFRFDPNAPLPKYLLEEAELSYQGALKKALDRAANIEREIALSESNLNSEVRKIQAAVVQSNNFSAEAKGYILYMENAIRIAK